MNVYQTPKKYTVTVGKIVTLSDTVKLFRLQFDKDVIFSFIPGQFVIVSHVVDGNEVKRSYSISSAPANKGYLEIVIRRKDNGEMTPWMHSLSEGMKLEIQGPFGRFNIKDKTRDFVFIAAGAGIAPFRGMIADYLENGGKNETMLIFGFRSEKDFFFKEEFEDLANRYKNFKLVPTASRPGPKWNGEHGRVNVILGKYIKPGTNKDVYLCGPSAMVEDTIRALTGIGFAKEQIYFEQWG